jgi:hypothetical protein
VLVLGADIVEAGACADVSGLVAVGAGAGFFVLLECAGVDALAVWTRFRHELRCVELLSELQ